MAKALDFSPRSTLRSRLLRVLRLPALLGVLGLGLAGASSLSDVGVVKTADKAQYNVGETVTYTIVVSNNTPLLPALAPTLFDKLSDSSLLSDVRWTCSGACLSKSGTGVPNGYVFPLLTSLLGKAVFTVTGTAAAPGDLTNTATLFFGDTVDYNLSNNVSAVTVKIVDPAPQPQPKPQLSLSKTSDGPWTAGGTGNYSLTVKNTSTTATSGTVTVRDLLPSGVSASSFSSGNWTCTVSGQQVTCTTAAVLAGGASSVITLPVKISSGASGSLKNRAAVGGGGDPDPIPDPATCVVGTTGVAAQCAENVTNVTAPGTPTTSGSTDLGVFKTIDLSNSRNPTISKFYVGDTVTYGLQVVNGGPGAADGAVVRDVSEPGLNVVSWTCRVVRGDAQCPATSGTGPIGDFVLPRFRPDSEIRITYKATVTRADPQLTNTATVTPPSGVTDTNTANNKDTVYICAFDQALPVGPELSVQKSSNGPWTVNQAGAEYRVTVTNYSNNHTTSGKTITVVDVLPNGITPASTSFSPATDWTCSVAGQRITCTTTAMLEATKSVTLVIPVKVSSAAIGSVTNKAVVSGGGDPDPAPDPLTCTPGSASPQNQCAQDTTTVRSADLATCDSLYTLASNNSNLGTTIYELSTGNVLGRQIAVLPGGATSATLALSPDGKTFYTIADNTNALLAYNVATATWRTLGSFTVASGVRVVRMAVTPAGVGYAMDSAGNLWSFTSTGTITPLSALKPTVANAPVFNQNGDFFATRDGRLYLLSAATGGAVSLWFVDPVTRLAEYLGDFKGVNSAPQYNGIAAVSSGVYVGNEVGELALVDLKTLALRFAPNLTKGSTDLASCYYPDFSPSLKLTKSVKKVSGADGTTVLPGDVLEYTIKVENLGTLPAGGVSVRDPLPEGVTYVPDSARVNGFTTTVTGAQTTNLGGATYPLNQPVGVCTADGAACTDQALGIGDAATVTFQVRVNDPFLNSTSSIKNVAIGFYNDGQQTPVEVPSNPTDTPVTKPVKVVADKTVQNITAGGQVGKSTSGKPGDVLEYCIATKNAGSASVSRINFADPLPANTNFVTGAYGDGRDIRVTTTAGTAYYTAAQDTDPAAVASGRVTYAAGDLTLAPGQSFTVCFRASIR